MSIVKLAARGDYFRKYLYKGYGDNSIIDKMHDQFGFKKMMKAHDQYSISELHKLYNKANKTKIDIDAGELLGLPTGSFENEEVTKNLLQRNKGKFLLGAGLAAGAGAYFYNKNKDKK